jgi:hypothetical protein
MPTVTAKVTTATPTTSFLATHGPRWRLYLIEFVMAGSVHRTVARVWRGLRRSSGTHSRFQ